ncbi:MAG: IS200/IS605 family transposase [Mailhella sp.]|nr:IS200/IS605 family transposase [Mailhella sp.]
MNENQSLSHTKWNCKYHIVFALKFRRKEIYLKIKSDIGKILRQLCEQKKVTIIESEMCVDHVHMSAATPPNVSVSSFVGYVKGKSSLMIFDSHANLKYKYGNRHFWCRGYYVDIVGKNTEKTKAYIQNQLNEDIMTDQYSPKEYYAPFTGSKNK